MTVQELLKILIYVHCEKKLNEEREREKECLHEDILLDIYIYCLISMYKLCEQLKFCEIVVFVPFFLAMKYLTDACQIIAVKLNWCIAELQNGRSNEASNL